MILTLSLWAHMKKLNPEISDWKCSRKCSQTLEKAVLIVRGESADLLLKALLK